MCPIGLPLAQPFALTETHSCLRVRPKAFWYTPMLYCVFGGPVRDDDNGDSIMKAISIFGDHPLATRTF